MITIDENVPMEVEDIGDLFRKVPGESKASKNAGAKAIAEYREAYKRVFGVLPEAAYTDGWFRIKGQTAGVKLGRLKELTIQLQYRSGDRE